MSQTPLSARGLLVTGVNRVECVALDLPEPGSHEVVLETLFSGVSPGTELRCLAGQQEVGGGDPFPFIPGYSLVGRVVQADAEGRVALGTVVYCRGTERSSSKLLWGGHVSHAVVDVDHVLPVPAAVPPAEAALLRVAAISYRGFRLAKVTGRPNVVVVGLGPIGQLSARIFAAGGAEVLGVDVSAERVEFTRRAGLPAQVIPAGGLNATVRQQWPAGADIVVDATGHAAVFKESLQLVRDRPWTDVAAPGGQLVVQGSYRGEVHFSPETAFTKEATILWPRDCLRQDLLEVLALMERRALRLDDLVGEPQPASRAQQVYDELRERPGARLTAVFAWNE